MNTYRYTLEKYKGTASRYTCPQCGSKKKFVRYIDTQTNQHLGDDIGRCDRQEKCGYHKKPEKGNTKSENLNTKQRKISKPLPSCSTDVALYVRYLFKTSLDNYHHNNLVLYLHSILPYADMERVVDAYHIGTQGTSTVFWQIDSKGYIRGGKVMAYNKDTGKRMKDIPQAIQWMHTLHKLDNYELKQCLFGEHLLRNNTMTVGIVESEKTALIAAALMPQMLWLATGGINNLSAAKCEVLQGRKVILYPDAGAYDKWLEVSKQIPNCTISPVLEHGFLPGSDIADYLLAA